VQADESLQSSGVFKHAALPLPEGSQVSMVHNFASLQSTTGVCTLAEAPVWV
jgi:hypothetical protein